MDYNYVRMRDALKAGDKEAAEKYRQLYEKGKKTKQPRRWLLVSVTILLLIAAALGTYIALMRGGEQALPAADAVTAPAETPVIVTQPEAAEEAPAEGSDG